MGVTTNLAASPGADMLLNQSPVLAKKFEALNETFVLSLGPAAVILMHLASFSVAILLVKQFEGSGCRGCVLSLQVGARRGFHI